MTSPSQNELSAARRPAAEADLSGPDLATAPATRTAEARRKPGMKARNGDIDALRAAVTLLVVFHHTAITYGAIGGQRGSLDPRMTIYEFPTALLTAA